jgi:hypothetical protein
MFATLLMSWDCQFQTQIVANSAAVAAPATRAQSKTCSSWQKREWKLVAQILTVGFAGTDMGRELVVAGSAIDPDRWFWWSKIWRSRSSGKWVGWWWQHSAQILTVGFSGARESESGTSLVVAGLCTDLDRWILLPKDLRGGS